MRIKLILLLISFSVFVYAQKKPPAGRSQPKKIDFNQTGSSQSIKALPDLVIVGEKFSDLNGNNIIDADEACFINFKVQNIGKGEALNVSVKPILKTPNVKGLIFKPLYELGNLKPEETRDVIIPVKGKLEIEDAVAEFRIEVLEERGLDAFPLEMKIETQKFRKPEVIVADAVFSTDDGGTIKLNYPIVLKIIVQNVGMGEARNVKADFSFPNPNCLMLGDTNRFEIGTLSSGQTKELDFLFTASRRYVQPDIPVRIDLSESYGIYSRDTILMVGLNQNLTARSQVIIQGVKSANDNIQLASLSADVDKNIPILTKKSMNRFALIIGNEDYTKYQRGLSAEVNVAFARNDANIFKDYALNSLGVPESNLFLLLDATTGEMEQKIDLISKLAAKLGNEAEIIFYYAGHGLPDEQSKIPYLIPVDVTGSNLQSAVKLAEVYAKLSGSGARKITVFLDACFSGGSREAGLIAARGIKIKPKEDNLSGNIVVFTASSGEQSALPYKEKQHGMFTYFLLKKLQETKALVSYSELSRYIQKTVSIESLRINQKEQDPQTNVSPDIIDKWGDWTFN